MTTHTLCAAGVGPRASYKIEGGQLGLVRDISVVAYTRSSQHLYSMDGERYMSSKSMLRSYWQLTVCCY
ncbi:mCG140250 [Mus musculus]|nr:mCG140250 [Mus musculus]